MSRFLPYIHNLRGVAILFVVGVHARGTADDWPSNPLTHELLTILFDAHEGNGTIMFLFISGFLFQHLMQKGFDLKKYLSQKFRFIILPYILISIPIILWRIQHDYEPWSVGENFGTKSDAYQFFYFLASGTHLSPFWFISAIIIYYISSPVFHWLDKPVFYKYIFPVIFVVGMFTFRSFNNGNPLLSYLHYLPVYFAGMWASYNKHRIFTPDVKPLLAIIALYIVVSILDFQHILSIAVNVTFEDVLAGHAFVFNFFLFRAILLCFMMAMLFYHLQHKPFPALEVLAEYSFGIYFVHFLLLVCIRKALHSLDYVIDFNFLTFLIFYTFLVSISTATVFLIKKITGRYSRSFIGS
jgi:peptidoglycan/LPS O-acetylase OafA/YrhL